MTSVRTIGRLSLYRRLLNRMSGQGVGYVFSHQLGAMSGCTAAQVRRDVMATGYTGTPKRGYNVRELVDSIGRFLDAPGGQAVALVGMGNLGRAILAYFSGRRPRLAIKAAFDVDPYKVNRVILGCRCHPLDELEDTVRDNGISVGIIAVPAQDAQAVADRLVRAGVRGILNFAPVPLRAGPDVFVEDIDMTMSLEKVAYFGRRKLSQKEDNK